MASHTDDRFALERIGSFSDAVLAFAITLLALELRLPEPLRPAVVYYAASVSATGLSRTVLWLYATRHRRLVDAHLPMSVVRAETWRGLSPPLIFPALDGHRSIQSESGRPVLALHRTSLPLRTTAGFTVSPAPDDRVTGGAIAVAAACIVTLDHEAL